MEVEVEGIAISGCDVMILSNSRGGTFIKYS